MRFRVPLPGLVEHRITFLFAATQKPPALDPALTAILTISLYRNWDSLNVVEKRAGCPDDECVCRNSWVGCCVEGDQPRSSSGFDVLTEHMVVRMHDRFFFVLIYLGTYKLMVPYLVFPRRQ